MGGDSHDGEESPKVLSKMDGVLIRPFGCLASHDGDSPESQS